MGSFSDKITRFLGGKTSEERIDEFKKIRNKYSKEASEEYESKTLDGCIDERAKMDLNPNDNIQKYKSDLKRWFLRTKEAFNQVVPKSFTEYPRSEKGRLWLEKMEMKDKDFPLIYYIKESESMLSDMGYDCDILSYCTEYYDTNPIGHWLVRYPRPWRYKKHKVTITHEYKDKPKKSRPRRKKRNG